MHRVPHLLRSHPDRREPDADLLRDRLLHVCRKPHYNPALACGGAEDAQPNAAMRRVRAAADIGCMAATFFSAAIGHETNTFAVTADAAGETMRRGFHEGLCATLGAAADEGWPAQLSARWLRAVVADPPGSAITPPRPPRVWGATSFARSLSAYGATRAMLARPDGTLFVHHQQPSSLRRHRRAALFGALIAEEAFARRVLRLGRSRARDHQRQAAAALLASLRIDAMRVVLAQAMRDGKRAARERFAELSATLFDEPLPAVFLGVLPQLRPADAASLAGTLMSRVDRDQLVEAFDEDWFANPEAVAHIHEQDALPLARGGDDRRLPVDEALAALMGQLERAL